MKDSVIAFDPCPHCENHDMCSKCELTFRRSGAIANPCEWISVEERLPKPQKLVLCIWERVDDGWNYGFARYQREDVWYVSNEGMPRVTHWMPIPEAPKGGEEE